MPSDRPYWRPPQRPQTPPPPTGPTAHADFDQPGAGARDGARSIAALGRPVGIYLERPHAPDPEAEQAYRQLLNTGQTPPSGQGMTVADERNRTVWRSVLNLAPPAQVVGSIDNARRKAALCAALL